MMNDILENIKKASKGEPYDPPKPYDVSLMIGKATEEKPKNKRIYRTRIFTNSEKNIESELSNFLATVSLLHKFKINNINVIKLGEHSNKEARIMVILIYSYKEEVK